MLERYRSLTLSAGLLLFASTAAAFEPSIVEVSEPRTVDGVEYQVAESDAPPAPEMLGEAPSVPDADYTYSTPPTQQYDPIATESSGNGNTCNTCDNCGKHGHRHVGKLKEDYWRHVGYPGGRYVAPFGASYHAAYDAHINNGLASQLILYQYDFQQVELDPDPSQLIDHGQRRLARMAHTVATTPLRLVIEGSGDVDLDRNRRRNVIASLQRMSPVPVMPESVIVATPTVRGLDGLEAELMNDNLLLQTRQRGLSTLPSLPGKILSPLPTAPQVIEALE